MPLTPLTPTDHDSERSLLIKILDSLKNLQPLSGNGSAGSVYPSGPPSGVSGTSYVNTANGTVYWWYSGAWH